MAEFYEFGDEGLDDAKEPQPVPEGEYTVKIHDWKTDDEGSIVIRNKAGNHYIMPLLEVVDCEEAEYAKRFGHYLGMVHDEMDAKEKNDTRFYLRQFFQAFGVDYTGRINFEDMIGSKADAILTVKADQGYGEQNGVVKFIAAR